MYERKHENQTDKNKNKNKHNDISQFSFVIIRRSITVTNFHTLHTKRFQ